MARKTVWVDDLLSMDVAAAAQGVVSLLTGVSPEEMAGRTITRIIAEIGLYSVTVAGAYGVQLVRLAIGAGEAEAVAAGILPDPSAPADFPRGGWLWRTSCAVSQNGVGREMVHRCIFDIKSQRKMGGSKLYLVVDNSDNLGTSFTIRANFIVRTLMRLP